MRIRRVDNSYYEAVVDEDYWGNGRDKLSAVVALFHQIGSDFGIRTMEASITCFQNELKDHELDMWLVWVEAHRKLRESTFGTACLN